jgi:hypothetical protein
MVARDAVAPHRSRSRKFWAARPCAGLEVCRSSSACIDSRRSTPAKNSITPPNTDISTHRSRERNWGEVLQNVGARRHLGFCAAMVPPGSKNSWQLLTEERSRSTGAFRNLSILGQCSLFVFINSDLALRPRCSAACRAPTGT